MVEWYEIRMNELHIQDDRQAAGQGPVPEAIGESRAEGALGPPRGSWRQILIVFAAVLLFVLLALLEVMASRLTPGALTTLPTLSHPVGMRLAL